MTGNLDCLNPSSFGLYLHPQQQLRTWTLQLHLLNLPRPSCPLPGPTEWPPTAFQFLILPPTMAVRSPFENARPLIALGLHCRVLQWQVINVESQKKKMQFISQASEITGRQQVQRVADGTHNRKSSSFMGFFRVLNIAGAVMESFCARKLFPGCVELACQCNAVIISCLCSQAVKCC